MIYLQLAGRLGNQLFQWAAALKVQESHGQVCLVYDDFHQSKPTPILEELTSGKIEIRKVNSIGRILQINDKFRIGNLFLKQIISSEQNPYSELDRLPTRTKVLRGYFQNWRNIIEFEDIIYEQLNDVVNKIFCNSIKLQTYENELTEYCSIHVRRGDYQDSNFGTLAPRFYVATKDFRSKPILLFTDQEDLPEAYKKAINPDYIFTPKHLSNEETFALMSRGSEVAIANSTFSWWAGFLSMKNGGQVLLPHPWLKGDSPKSAFQYPGMYQEKAIFN